MRSGKLCVRSPLRHQGDGLREAGERLADAAAQHHECGPTPSRPRASAISPQTAQETLRWLAMVRRRHLLATTHQPSALRSSAQAPWRRDRARRRRAIKLSGGAVSALERRGATAGRPQAPFAARRRVVHKARLLQRGSGLTRCTRRRARRSAFCSTCFCSMASKMLMSLPMNSSATTLAAGIFGLAGNHPCRACQPPGWRWCRARLWLPRHMPVGTLQRALLALVLFVLHRGGDVDEILALAANALATPPVSLANFCPPRCSPVHQGLHGCAARPFPR